MMLGYSSLKALVIAVQASTSSTRQEPRVSSTFSPEGACVAAIVGASVAAGACVAGACVAGACVTTGAEVGAAAPPPQAVRIMLTNTSKTNNLVRIVFLLLFGFFNPIDRSASQVFSTFLSFL